MFDFTLKECFGLGRKNAKYRFMLFMPLKYVKDIQLKLDTIHVHGERSKLCK